VIYRHELDANCYLRNYQPLPHEEALDASIALEKGDPSPAGAGDKQSASVNWMNWRMEFEYGMATTKKALANFMKRVDRHTSVVPSERELHSTSVRLAPDQQQIKFLLVSEKLVGCVSDNGDLIRVCNFESGKCFYVFHNSENVLWQYQSGVLYHISKNDIVAATLRTGETLSFSGHTYAHCLSVSVVFKSKTFLLPPPSSFLLLPG
jgi:hypothetical protein